MSILLYTYRLFNKRVFVPFWSRFLNIIGLNLIIINDRIIFDEEEFLLIVFLGMLIPHLICSIPSRDI